MYSHQNFNIFTDNLNTINSIQNIFRNNDIATNIINQVKHLKNQNKNVQLIWLPGHFKMYGNNLANQHAKYPIVSKASEQKYSTILDTKKYIKIITQNIWQKSLVKPKQLIKQSINLWPHYKTSRKTEIIINRLRIDHTHLTQGPLMKSQPLTEFFSCGVTLTVKHLMTECRLNKEERIRLNIQTNLYEIIGPDCQPENVMSFLSTIGIERLIQQYIVISRKPHSSFIVTKLSPKNMFNVLM